jgi:hypothetical protein
MPDTTLIGGPYRAPRCRVGRILESAVTGDQVVSGMTGAPIPWPYVQRRGDKRSLIVCGGLEQAIRTESIEAVAYHWGVSRWTVSRWRRALAVQRYNRGTLAAWSRLRDTRLGGSWRHGS